MAIAHFMMLNNGLLKKYPDVVPEQALLNILYRKSANFMAKNVKNNKHTRHIYRKIHFVRNGEECNLRNTVWCEGGLKLKDIGTNNVRGDELNSRLGYSMVRLEN